MAPRQPSKTTNDEVFTDLISGGNDVDNPITHDPDLDDLPTPPRRRGSQMAENNEIPDDELDVVDDPDEEVDPAAAVEDDEDEDEETPEAPAPVEVDIHHELEYDPKDAQILGFEAQSLETAEKNATAQVARADADIAAAKAAMKRAKEAGDTDADIAATEAYSSALISKQNGQGILDDVGRNRDVLKQKAANLFAKASKDSQNRPILDKPVYREVRKNREAAAPAAPKLSKHAENFFKLNPWMKDKKHAEAAATLLKMDEALGNEGTLDKDDPKYFTELGRRFNRVKPGLYKNLDGKAIAVGVRRRQAGTRPPGQGGTQPGAQRPREGTKIGLTNADLDNMRMFQLDPDNKEHRREYLAQKRASASAGA